MGLHVQLDVEYASDERIVEAGPMAELLYVRALCWCKKNPKTNGAFTWSQLAVFAHAIPQARKHAARLVEVGAWEDTGKGAQVAAWLKRNKSGEDIASAADMASMLGIQGNHERWHVGKDGKPSNKCPLCLAAFRASGDPIGSRSGTPIGSVSPKEEEQEEVEPEEEPQPETQEEEEEEPAAARASIGSSKQNRTEIAAAALEILIQHKVTGAHSPGGLRAKLERELPKEWGDKIAQYLRTKPNASAEVIAYNVLGVPKPYDWEWSGAGYAAREYHLDPTCTDHGDDGLANFAPEGSPAEYGPCRCRSTVPYPQPPMADVIELARKDSA